MLKFPFVDLTTGQRWQLDLGDGGCRYGYSMIRRVPDTGAARLSGPGAVDLGGTRQARRRHHPVPGNAVPAAGAALVLAALNVDPPEGSAGLAGAVVRETLLAGGKACRPLIARDGLSAVLVDPAIRLLRAKGAEVRLSANCARSRCRMAASAN